MSMIRINKVLIFSCIVSLQQQQKRIDYYFYVVTWLDEKRNRGFWGSEKFLENTNLSAV